MSELALQLIEENKRKYAAGEDASFLDLGNCGLKELPEALFACTWLIGLNFGVFYIDFERDKYLKSANKGPINNLLNQGIIALQKLSKLKYICLSNNHISDLRPLAALTLLNSLDVSDNQISDLSPLAALTSLNSLDVSDNQISDLSPLAALTSLNSLIVSDNQISDLSPLAALTSLNSLIVSKNQISDLGPLAALTSLNSLDIRSNQIIDLSPLAALTSLNSLDVGFNQISDLSQLAILASLNSLDVSSNQISDLSPLAALASLNSLIVSKNQISDLSPLAALASLNSLDVSDNQIIDLSPLAALTSLNSLNVSSNKIIDLSPLAALTSLNSLSVGNNQISDLSPLAALTSLNSLSVGNNQISDLSPLAALASLNSLYVGNNQISDLSPLAALTSLNSLWVENNQIGDLNPLASLASLDLLYANHNQISDLSPLAALTSLNWLCVSYNQISDLDPLAALASLYLLHVSYNQISDLGPLAALASLNSLDIGYNQISDLSLLAAPASLNSLDISGNQISDLSPLAALTSLKSLNVYANQINYFDAGLLGEWPYLEELHIAENAIKNIPSAICSLLNCLSALKDYFKDVQKEPIPIYESKLILLGNGRVGKTCLVKRMLDNTFDADEPSTHAIQLRQWFLDELAEDRGLDEILLNIWDFGGQDIYHATHRLFMQTDALFLLVWDAETASSPVQEELLPGGKMLRYTNHPIHYWLSYIKTLSNNSPVIIVQTKMDKGGEKIPELSRDELNEFNVIERKSVESSRKTASGFAGLKEKISQAIRKRMETVCTQLPAQWYRIRKKVALLQENGDKKITLTFFKKLCEDEGLDESSTETLLQYLHNTGVLFYKEGLFGDELIIDQKWAIDAVYVLFDRKGNFTRLHGNGLFSGEDISDIWDKSYSTTEQELFLDFMLRCEICFEIGYDYKRPFVERQFIAPQLLTEDKPSDSIANAFHERETIYIRYKYRFLHDAVIQRFIVRTGYIAKTTEMWKHGILLRPIDGVALIEADAARNEITVRIKTGNKTLTDKIHNELKELTDGKVGIETFYSLDGENYVSLDKLKTNPKENDKIQATNGEWVLLQPYRIFLNPNENIRFEKPKPLTSNVMEKPKVFFSYAWNEPSEKIVTELYESLKKDGYPVIIDKNDLPYKGTISEFMETIGRGECVVVAISDKYLKSENCMFELYELFRNARLDTAELLKKIYPIRVESIKLNDSDIQYEYSLHWKTEVEKCKKLTNEFKGYGRKLEKIENINGEIGNLLLFLNDINASTKETLSEDNFAAIKKAIVDRIS